MRLSTNSYDNLIATLEKEFGLLSDMVELMQKEKDVITGSDVSAINAHINNKQLLAAKIALCEEARQAELKSLGLSGKRLSELAAEAAPEYRHRLLSLVSRFKAIHSSIAELNKLNEMLIEKSLFYIRCSRRFLDTFGIEPSGKVSMEV